MSENSGRNDPSMKEILGSIRRIINEDNAQNAATETASGDEEILDLTEEVGAEELHRPRLDPSFGAAHEKGEAPEIRREPVLGLHSPLPPAGQYEPEQPSEETSPPATDEAPAALGEYGTTGYVEDDLPAETQEEETSSAPAGEIATEPFDEPVRSTDETVHEEQEAETQTPAAEAESLPREEAHPVTVEPSVSEPSELEVAQAAESVREIVSETTTVATATAIGELTRAMEEQTNKLKLGPGEETISDMVREMLRPMLREWLDVNLPGIVERIVRREIQKLVDRAEADD